MSQKTGPKHSSVRKCGAGSATALIRQAGELVAIPHPSKALGYKDPSPAFDGTSTNAAFVRKVRAAADSTPMHKHLMVYSPNAPRNRTRETMENIPGKRYGVHPTTKTETYRGQSHVQFHDPDLQARKPWKTTYQVFTRWARVVNIHVGLDNPGIASMVTKQMHKAQGA